MQGCGHLGFMYEYGNGVEKNEQKAVELYKKACDGGEVHGCTNLGVMYEYAIGVEKNEQKAVELYKKACDKIDMRSHMLDVEKKSQNHMPDIGRMVTWMGTPGNDLNSILKYSYALQWKDEQAKIEDVETENPEPVQAKGIR